MYSNDTMYMEGSNNWLPFTLGALLGACVGLLFAPKTGSEIRHIIADKGRELSDKVGQGIDMVGTFGRDKFGSNSAPRDEGKYV